MQSYLYHAPNVFGDSTFSTKLVKSSWPCPKLEGFIGVVESVV